MTAWTDLFSKHPIHISLGLHRNCPRQRMSPRWADPTGTPMVCCWVPEPGGCPSPSREPARHRGRWWSGNCLAEREGRQAAVCPSSEPQALLIKGSVSHRFPAGPAMTSRFPSGSATADLENQQPRGKGGGRGRKLPLLPPTSRSSSSWAVPRHTAWRRRNIKRVTPVRRKSPWGSGHIQETAQGCLSSSSDTDLYL